MKKTEKKEKEGQEVRKSADILHSKFQEVLDAIDKVKEARKVFRELTAAGCDRNDLLAALYWYCGKSPANTAAPMTNIEREKLRKRIEEVRKEEEAFKGRLEDASNKLKGAANLVDGLLSEFPERTGMTYYGENLPAKMRDFAEHLNRLQRGAKRNLRDIKKDRDGTIVGGRKQYLFYLTCMVREVTEQPNERVARLVAAVRGEKEPNYTKLANTLGRAVNRFKDRNLLWCIIVADEVHAKFVDAREAREFPITPSS